jgi:hypothetical protein
MYKLLASMEVGLLRKAPAIVCVVGGRDRDSIIDAGRLMNRLWTDLNASGIAVQPYYVVPDQLTRLREGTLAPGFDATITRVDADLRTLLQIAPDEMLHIMFRIGYPLRDPVRSKRLPLDMIFFDDSPLASSLA